MEYLEVYGGESLLLSFKMEIYSIIWSEKCSFIVENAKIETDLTKVNVEK